MKLKILVFLLIAMCFILLPRHLLAVKPSGLPTKAVNRGQISPRPTKVQERKPTGTPGQAGKLKSCQAREAAIKTRSENLTEFATRLIATFDKIAARVEEFYATKGLSVSNYSTLVADVAAKKLAAQTAVTKAQSSLANFSCDTGDPKTTLRSFNEEMKLVHTALKDYKTSVRNLIVGIHSQAPSGKPTRKPTNVRPTNARPTKGGAE